MGQMLQDDAILASILAACDGDRKQAWMHLANGSGRSGDLLTLWGTTFELRWARMLLANGGRRSRGGVHGKHEVSVV
jgi:hypothetical protein